MRIKDGQKLCPAMIVLTPDPDKYREVHLALKKVLSIYTPEISPKSIDEFVLDFTKVPKLRGNLFSLGQRTTFGLKLSESNLLASWFEPR